MIVGKCVRAAVTAPIAIARRPQITRPCILSFSSAPTNKSRPAKQPPTTSTAPPPPPKPIQAIEKKDQQPVEEWSEEELFDFSPNATSPPPAPTKGHATTTAASGNAAQLSHVVSQLQQENKLLQHDRAMLQQENERYQAQLVYHSAVEAIYGETGFNQLRNIIAELTEDEAHLLKGLGFESESLVQQLESRQRDLVISYSHQVETDLAKHINLYIKKLREQHRQSSSAATATQQTLRNAGVPDTVVAAAVASMQPHLEELQGKLARWEKLKADVDLLLATHGNT